MNHSQVEKTPWEPWGRLADIGRAAELRRINASFYRGQILRSDSGEP
jgi:hypothetical protein